MPRLKKRADGRYRRRKKINGVYVDFYGKTIAEVDEKIAVYERRANAPLTFEEIAKKWKNDRWEKLSITTQRGYNAAYNNAVEYFGSQYAAEITTPDVNRYLKIFIDDHLALKTVQAQKTVISVIYENAIINGDVKENPAKGFSLPRDLPKTPRTIPEDDDLQKIATGDYEWLLPRLLLFTGMRCGEALALNYEDIDRKKKTITVNKAVVFDSNNPVVVPRTKTKAGMRTIPLTDALARYLPSNSHGRIFEYKYSALRKKWDKWQKELGVTCTMHQLRHAYASILLDAGISAKDAQVVLGHSDVSVTQNIYTHILQSREKNTAETLNKYLNNSQFSSQKMSQKPETA